MNNYINDVLDRLSKSTFRNSFHLKEKDFVYIEDKGMNKIKEHAYDFVNKRLKDISNINDGKQTPMKGHPVFIAQHATGTCCRGCLEKWHHISKNRNMSNEDVDYVVEVIMTWIYREIKFYKT